MPLGKHNLNVKSSSSSVCLFVCLFFSVPRAREAHMGPATSFTAKGAHVFPLHDLNLEMFSLQIESSLGVCLRDFVEVWSKLEDSFGYLLH